MNVLFGTGFYLLQGSDWFKDPDPTDLVTIGIAMGIIAVVIVILTLVNRNIKPSSGSGSSSSRHFSIFEMRRVASTYGLSRQQRVLLETIFKKEGIGNPEHILQNHEALDRVFMRAIKSSEKTSPNITSHERNVSNIFTLRNIFETIPAKNAGSFGEVRQNSDITLVYGNASYVVKVLSSGKSGVIVEPPKARFGSPVNLSSGTKVSLFCKLNSPQGFSIDAKVYGTKKTENGDGVQLAYAGSPKSLAQRRFRRKESKAICNIFVVHAEQSGRRKKNEKLIAGSKAYRSTLLNISIGGCAIHTDAPVHGGTVLKIEFLFSRDSKISVLGQVLRSNRSSSSGTIVHVKFVRIPRRAFIDINYLIFGYDRN